MSRFRWSDLFARKAGPRGGRRRARPVVEALEERALLSTAGTLDPSFGSGGVQVTTFNASTQAEAVAIDRSGGPTTGDIYVAGFATDPATPLRDFALLRYLPNGQLDTSFDGGEVLTNFGNTLIGTGNDLATALAVQRDGKIVVGGAITAGAVPNVRADFGVARYNPDGSLDPNFGSGGLVVVDFTSLVAVSPSNASVAALAIDSQNRIVVGGSVQVGKGGIFDFALARLNPDGSPDGNFGTNGQVVANINSTHGLAPGDDVIRGLAIDASDNIVVAGGARDGTIKLKAPPPAEDFVVARFQDGTLDGNFGKGGATVTTFSPGSSAEANGIALGPGGRIVAAGSVLVGTTTASLGLAEYRPDGTPNPDFGSNGITTTTIIGHDFGSAVAFDPAGNIVVAGSTFNGGAPAGSLFAVARYLPGGTLDPAFDPGGFLPGVVFTSIFSHGDFANGLAVQPDGGIVVAGGATRADGSLAIALARYSGQSSTAPPPAPPHRPIVAELVPVKFGKKRKLMVEVLDAATGALKAEFLSPFQHPRFSAIQASAVQGNGAGLPDEVLVTARRGRHTVRASFVV